MSTEKRYALVTGGSGDIGSAIVHTLCNAGYVTTVLDLHPELKPAALTGADSVRFIQGSTTSPDSLEAALNSMPRVDLAVMCAGTVAAQPFLEIDEELWRRQLDINLTGSFLASQAAARRMVADQTRGELIFVSSWVAQRAWPEITAYSASKAGVDQLMRQAALELSAYGIRSNAVAPGIVMAGLAKVQFETEPQYAARASKAIPLGSPQTAAQIGEAVGFLASSAASSMTGSVLLIDGGCSLGALQ